MNRELHAVHNYMLFTITCGSPVHARQHPSSSHQMGYFRTTTGEASASRRSFRAVEKPPHRPRDRHVRIVHPRREPDVTGVRLAPDAARNQPRRLPDPRRLFKNDDPAQHTSGLKTRRRPRSRVPRLRQEQGGEGDRRVRGQSSWLFLIDGSTPTSYFPLSTRRTATLFPFRYTQ